MPVKVKVAKKVLGSTPPEIIKTLGLKSGKKGQQIPFTRVKPTVTK